MNGGQAWHESRRPRAASRSWRRASRFLSRIGLRRRDSRCLLVGDLRWLVGVARLPLHRARLPWLVAFHRGGLAAVRHGTGRDRSLNDAGPHFSRAIYALFCGVVLVSERRVILFSPSSIGSCTSYHIEDATARTT